MAPVVTAGLDTLHLCDEKGGGGGFTTGCPHWHTSSLPCPRATSPRCPPTHTASAAPRGREWSRSGQTRRADACPRHESPGCRAPFGLPVGSRELVKALVIKIALNDCLSALSGDGSDPTSALDIASGGKQVVAVRDRVESAHGCGEQRDMHGAGGGHRAGRGMKQASAKGGTASGQAHVKSP